MEEGGPKEIKTRSKKRKEETFMGGLPRWFLLQLTMFSDCSRLKFETKSTHREMNQNINQWNKNAGETKGRYRLGKS